MIQRVAAFALLPGASRTTRTREEHMRKYIALALWAGADVLEIIRGGLLAGAVKLLGKS